jgi:hypothetical protein
MHSGGSLTTNSQNARFCRRANGGCVPISQRVRRAYSNTRMGPGSLVSVSGQHVSLPPGSVLAGRALFRGERFSLATERHNVLSDRVFLSCTNPLRADSNLSAGRRGTLQSHRRDPRPLGLFSLPVRVRQHSPGDFCKASESQFVTPSSRFQTCNDGEFLCATSCSEIETRRSR